MAFIPRYFLLLFALTASALSVAQPKILKATYASTPVSQYKMTDRDMQSTPTRASEREFMQGITDYYSLYVNLEDRSSLYTLDSTVQIRPIGWDKIRAALLDTVYFTLKSADNRTYKHEWIMNRVFFSEGRVGDFKWKLYDEEKTISGLQCRRAVAVNYPMLTAWYTTDVPVSNGPSAYQGLPGLAVWIEDYERTIELLDFYYGDDLADFNKKYTEKMVLFKRRQKEKGVDSSKESRLMIQKGDFCIGSYEYFQKKPYKDPNL